MTLVTGSIRGTASSGWCCPHTHQRCCWNDFYFLLHISGKHLLWQCMERALINLITHHIYLDLDFDLVTYYSRAFHLTLTILFLLLLVYQQFDSNHSYNKTQVFIFIQTQLWFSLIIFFSHDLLHLKHKMSPTWLHLLICHHWVFLSNSTDWHAVLCLLFQQHN